MTEQQKLPFPEYEETFICSEDDCRNKINKETDWSDSEGNFYCKDHVGKCAACSEESPISELVLRGNYRYCQDCFDELFEKCPSCDEIVKKEEILYPRRTNRRTNNSTIGCTECSIQCSDCGIVADKEESHEINGDTLCNDCFSQNYGTCENCEKNYHADDLHYVENEGSYCFYCYDQLFERCKECGEDFQNDQVVEIDDNYFCHDCAKELKRKSLGEHEVLTEKVKDFSYTKKDKYLSMLVKLLPITIKELKTKHQSIAAGLADLIAFAKGQTLTAEIVSSYRNSLMPEVYPVDYSTWSGMQRSTDEFNQSQLVLNILASDKMLSKMKSIPGLYDLFCKVNDTSAKSGHPYSENQLGWARLELDPNHEYILVDEVQSDSENSAYQLTFY